MKSGIVLQSTIVQEKWKGNFAGNHRADRIVLLGISWNTKIQIGKFPKFLTSFKLLGSNQGQHRYQFD